MQSAGFPNEDWQIVASGDLDRAFGEGGWVDTDVGDFDRPHAVAVQRDGKIVLAGETVRSVRPCAVLVRYSSDGELDRGFGRSGIVRACSRRIQGANDVAIQPDGKLVVLGWQYNYGQWHDFTLFSLVRYLPNGRPDPTFGRDGFVQVGLRTGQFPSAVTLQRDGRILVAGFGGTNSSTTSDFVVARLRRNGKLDRAFSRDGIKTVDFRGRSDGAQGLDVQRDGRIVVVGSSTVGVKPGHARFALVRLNPNGKLDRRFGKRLTRPASGGAARAVLVQPDGRIVVAGVAHRDPWGRQTTRWVVARYLGTGRLDRSFGQGGIVISDFGTGDDSASSIELQPDGKILVGGQVYVDQAVARYRAR